MASLIVRSIRTANHFALYPRHASSDRSSRPDGQLALFARNQGRRYRAQGHRCVSGPTNLPYNLRGHLTEGLWDYSAKARYAFNPSASVYVSYATGTKAGGFVSNNSTLYYDILHNGASVDYNAEKAQSWEIGGKFLFLNDTANLNIALFDTSFNNLQVPRHSSTRHS